MMTIDQNQEFVFDVFLSHSSKDQEIVREIAIRLKQDGIRVWFDEWELVPGDHFPTKIHYGFENSRVLVLFMSANGFGSDWVEFESQATRSRDPLNKNGRFIPVRLDDAPIKDSLAPFIYIDWYSQNREQEYLKLLARCRPQMKPTSKPSFTLEGHSQPVTAIKWLTHSTSLLSTSFDGTVRRWNLPRGTDQKHQHRILWRSRDRVLAMALRSDDAVAVFSRDGDITVLNPPKWVPGKQKLRQVTRNPTVHSAAWLSDGSLITAEDDGITRITDHSGTIQRKLVGHTNLVRTILAIHGRNLVVTGSHDRSIRVWDIVTGEQLSCRHNAHKDDINALCRIGTNTFASSGDDGRIGLWRLNAPGKGISSIGSLDGHKGYVIELSVSRDEQLLASKSNRRVCLWSLKTRLLVDEIEEPMEVSWPVGLAFHPRENLLATLGSEGRSIRIWKYLDTGTIV